MEQHIKLLGFKAEDKVTGFSGVITSIAFDLYGCVQAIVTPPIDKKDINPGKWFDVARLKILNKKRVMELPDFESGYLSLGKKGPAEKPAPNN